MTTQREFETAATAARDAGHPKPVLTSIAAMRGTYLPLATAIKALPKSWINDDLFALGPFLAANPERNAPFALSHVFRRPHRTFTFSAASTRFFQELGAVPTTGTNFRR